MDDHREAQLDSQRDRSDDDVMDIDDLWKNLRLGLIHVTKLSSDLLEIRTWLHRELIPISLSQTSEGISIPYSLSAMNQNNPRNLSRKDLQHRIESSSQALDMVYRIRDHCESLVTIIASRAGTCFTNMCCMATVPDKLLFETITLTHNNNQFITLVIKQFFEDRFQAWLDHYKAKIGSDIRTLNNDFYNRLDSYLTNLRNRYFDNIPSDLTTSSGGNVRQ
ncbi:hypothetical protein PGTUg99_037793 [Puccinia graminis f. sp. tritici]|uniref:Uncharacterized protein n=1 Tax=Puccinia graminis f. sp. tritici TaxID=56615 RepID=A0A5B0SNU7_PUCGR|nr:hypothetical protein PGTUg99_037793 [Puccinia graminis f. sp. tritici]